MIVTNGDISLLDGTSAALGSFDGMHTAHCALVGQAVEYAKKNGVKSAVFTFDRNTSDAKRIITVEERNAIIENMGADILFVKTFDGDFKSMTPDSFTETYLKKCSCINVGFNFRFGSGRKGSTEDIMRFCRDNNIECNILPAVTKNGETVSSTLIRKYLSEGNFERAKPLLGRDFSVSGTVSHGDEIGRTIGFPTMNIERSGLIIPYGVYMTETLIDGVLLPGVTNAGGKPTIRDGADRVETHVLNYSGDAYGKKITVYFKKKLRDIVRFETIEQLKLQLNKDVLTVLNAYRAK